ncbi:hypothetical protein PR048_016848 [Dryococelus australis]|uniref:Uncharacterized protein n=1 Tax=Dryococelus australis TaxID=614101 RepID=A0ABQ9H7Y5_9NEOP|nr:hypothetical protein PR048_016848 [Dryococelus australis]
MKKTPPVHRGMTSFRLDTDFHIYRLVETFCQHNETIRRATCLLLEGGHSSRRRNIEVINIARENHEDHAETLQLTFRHELVHSFRPEICLAGMSKLEVFKVPVLIETACSIRILRAGYRQFGGIGPWFEERTKHIICQLRKTCHFDRMVAMLYFALAHVTSLRVFWDMRIIWTTSLFRNATQKPDDRTTTAQRKKTQLLGKPVAMFGELLVNCETVFRDYLVIGHAPTTVLKHSAACNTYYGEHIAAGKELLSEWCTVRKQRPGQHVPFSRMKPSEDGITQAFHQGITLQDIAGHSRWRSHEVDGLTRSWLDRLPGSDPPRARPKFQVVMLYANIRVFNYFPSVLKTSLLLAAQFSQPNSTQLLPLAEECEESYAFPEQFFILILLE